MGGKNYFCDYCCCYLKNDINVRKTHYSGLTHNIAKANYMRPFEDPRKLLEEESAKVPCSRFPKGYCKFGLFCQFSHYSATQLNEIREIVEKLHQRSQSTMKGQDKKQRKYSANIKEKRKRRKHRKLKSGNLPPSLRDSYCKTTKSKIFICKWG